MEERLTDPHDACVGFVTALHAQLAIQPNLRDYLLWWGGSLEYWIHISATTVGGRGGRAARSEVPYRTRSRPKGAAANGLWTKWADGGAVLSEAVDLLLEVKCAPAPVEIGGPLYDVGRYDLPALAGIDLKETWGFWYPGERVTEDDWISYTDPAWRGIRSEVTDLWGLSILLVHGPDVRDDVPELVGRRVAEGIANANRYGSVLPPEAGTRLGRMRALDRLDLIADGARGSIFSSTVPLGRPPQQGSAVAASRTIP